MMARENEDDNPQMRYWIKMTNLVWFLCLVAGLFALHKTIVGSLRQSQPQVLPLLELKHISKSLTYGTQ
jgi:hypothetical protein